MKESKVIDMDCDGVILDIIRDTHVQIRKEKESDFNFYGYLDAWEMPRLQKERPDMYEYVKNLWDDPEFMGSLNRIPYAFSLIKELIGQGYKVIIHTHMPGKEEVRNVRKEFFGNLWSLMAMDVSLFGQQLPSLLIDETPEKRTISSDVCIEDNYMNLKKSDAKIKVLIQYPYNKDVTIQDFTKSGERGYIFKSVRELYNNIKSNNSILRKDNTSNEDCITCIWCTHSMYKAYEYNAESREHSNNFTLHLCKECGTTLHEYTDKEIDDLWVLADGTLC